LGQTRNLDKNFSGISSKRMDVEFYYLLRGAIAVHAVNALAKIICGLNFRRWLTIWGEA
jgi:hypothetical protein